jgi:hypothetical protein
LKTTKKPTSILQFTTILETHILPKTRLLFFVSPPSFSFQRPINNFECVSRCVPAGEVAAAMAGTSRGKKKKDKKSKWEMVQRQTE